MDKNELLKYLICEIDLVMHDKDYRFENEDGTWYSRESCKNLTNEEVFEELKTELRQLAKIEDVNRFFKEPDSSVGEFKYELPEKLSLDLLVKAFSDLHAFMSINLIVFI